MKPLPHTAPPDAQVPLRRVLDNLFAFVGVLTLDGTLIEANRAPLEAAGLAAADVIGRKFWDCYWWNYSTDIQDQLKQSVQRAAAGAVVRYDVPVRMVGDSRMWIDFQIAPLRDDAGQITHLIPSGIDITARRATERALQASHDTFRHLVEHSPFGVYAVDADFRLVQASAGAQKVFENVRPLLGRDFAEVLRTIWQEPFASEAIARFRHTLETGEPYHAPSTVERRNDIAVIESYDWKIERLTMPDGRPGVVCHFYDLSERQRFEAALRDKTEQIESLLTNAPLGVAFFDAQHRYVQINRDLADINGIAAEDHIGRRVEDLLPGTAPSVVPVLDRIFRTGEAVRNFEVSGETPRQPGVERHWLTGFYPVKDGMGRITLVGVWVAEITDRKRAEQALRVSEERFHLAARATKDAIWDWDFSTNCRWWSEAIHHAYGYEVVSDDASWWRDRVHPDDRQRVIDGIERVVQSGGTYWSDEYQFATAGGDYVFIRDRGYVARDPSGKAIRMVGAMQDMTDRKRADEAHAEAARQKDEFIAVLAHELRNPLAPIRTSVAILQQQGDPDPLMMKCRAVIERQVGHMARLLDDLLDVSRLSRGTLTLQLSDASLSDILDAAVETSRPLIDQQRCELTIERPSRDVTVHGDAARLTQVFANVLNNAAKYNRPHGQIRVRVRPDDNGVAVSVADTGIGLPQHFVEQAFELFTQTSEARERAPGGLGIGLALARRVVELHGGTISASSPGPDQGSEFSVWLPVVQTKTTDASVTPGAASWAAPLSSRILIAEDNVDAAEMWTALLGALGSDVEVAYDGETAVRRAEEYRPNVLLLDIGLPALDGYEVCRRIRRAPWSVGMKIVALTGWGQEEDRRRTAAAGFDRHLVKPVSPEHLVDTVRQLLGPLQ